MLVDDAHASGVLGRNGRGTRRPLRARTAGSRSRSARCRRRSASLGGYVAGSAGPARHPHPAGPAVPVLDLPSAGRRRPPAARRSGSCRTSPSCIERLWANTRRFKAELARLGFDTGRSETPITPVMMGDPETPRSASATGCSSEGVFAQPVVFPTVALDQARTPHDRHRRARRRALDRALEAFATRRPRAGRDRGVSRAPGGRTAGSSGRCRDRSPGARPAARRAPPHRPVARQRRRRSTPTRAGRRARDRRARDHRPRRLRPGDAGLRRTRRSPSASATVRDAAERWATAGVAIRFGVELTYDRRYEADIRGHLRAARLRLRDRLGPRLAPTRRTRRPRRRRSSPAGRWRRSSRRTSTRSIGAARSGLFDTIGHLDFVKRYLAPARDARGPRRRAGAVRAAPAGARRDRHGPRGQHAAACARPPRETYPSAAIVARFRELGGERVTIGSDAHRAERLRVGARRRLSSRDRAPGSTRSAFRRGGERVRRAAASDAPRRSASLTRGSTVRYDPRRRRGRAARGGGPSGGPGGLRIAVRPLPRAGLPLHRQPRPPPERTRRT